MTGKKPALPAIKYMGEQGSDWVFCFRLFVIEYLLLCLTGHYVYWKLVRDLPVAGTA
jgi:hypothetical protein